MPSSFEGKKIFSFMSIKTNLSLDVGIIVQLFQNNQKVDTCTTLFSLDDLSNAGITLYCISSYPSCSIKILLMVLWQEIPLVAGTCLCSMAYLPLVLSKSYLSSSCKVNLFSLILSLYSLFLSSPMANNWAFSSSSGIFIWPIVFVLAKSLYIAFVFWQSVTSFFTR